MKRKKWLAIIAVVAAALAVLQLAFFLVIRLALWSQGIQPVKGGSIGVIGGADGPTAVYVGATTVQVPVWLGWLPAAGCAVVVVICGVWARRKQNENPK